MGPIEETAQVLTDKLSPEQLHLLCQIWDTGHGRELFDGYLLPKDAENFPAKYTG